MARKSYPTDLTDDDWRVLEPLLPAAKPGGHPRRADTRELVDAGRSLLRAGYAWRVPPHDLPPWQTVSTSFRARQADGTWERIAGARRRDRRVALEVATPAAD